jgi:hypothetical protein
MALTVYMFVTLLYMSAVVAIPAGRLSCARVVAILVRSDVWRGVVCDGGSGE